MTAPHTQCQPEADALRQHTPTPWFVSGVRYRMNGGEWQNINRYDASKKQDENIACVSYDPRTGLGLADAHFIVEAVNSHATLQARVAELERILREARRFIDPDCDPSALTNRALTLQINRALAPSLERSGGAT